MRKKTEELKEPSISLTIQVPREHSSDSRALVSELVGEDYHAVQPPKHQGGARKRQESHLELKHVALLLCQLGHFLPDGQDQGGGGQAAKGESVHGLPQVRPPLLGSSGLWARGCLRGLAVL